MDVCHWLSVASGPVNLKTLPMYLPDAVSLSNVHQGSLLFQFQMTGFEFFLEIGKKYFRMKILFIYVHLQKDQSFIKTQR